MKNFFKIILLIILLFFEVNNSFAQAGKTSKDVSLKSITDAADPKKQAENIIRTANDLKSGNWQDILSSFLQLSVSDLTGTNKGLNFKSTLFALKVKADTSLLIDNNYVKQKFARNFQFDFSLKLDSSYKFTGFQGGFTWAIINKRDSTVMSLANTIIDTLYGVSQIQLQKGFIAFQRSMSDTNDNIIKDSLSIFLSVKKELEDIISKGGFVKIKSLPVRLRPFLKTSYDENIQQADSLFYLELEKLRTKPLLTLSVNSTFKNDQQAFNNGDAQLIFLQAIKSQRSRTEIDARAHLNVRDTLLTSKERRADINLSAGLNFSLFLDKSQKSFFEFKPYFAYQNILTTPIGNEKKSVFSANADIRLRITDNLWLPVTIKYDFNKKNFLGFLNIAFNFDAFKKQSQ